MVVLWHRHVVNGEILGVSLLLEDVLQNGLPDIFTQQPDDSTPSGSTGQRSRPSTSTSRRPPSRHGDKRDSTADDGVESAVAVETGPYGDIPKGTVSFSTNPQAAVKLINLFLLVCSRLELLKTDWGCRKLGANKISTSKLYRTLWWVLYFTNYIVLAQRRKQYLLRVEGFPYSNHDKYRGITTLCGFWTVARSNAYRKLSINNPIVRCALLTILLFCILVKFTRSKFCSQCTNKLQLRWAR